MPKILLTLLFCLLTACNDSPPAMTKLPENATVLAFGDSLTYGTGSSGRHDYPSILSRLTDLSVINEGTPGEISRDGAERLPALLDKYQPELLILIHGGNDFLRKIPEQETADHLSEMIDEALQRNIGVIMAGIPKPTLFLLNSADIYSTVAEQKQIPVDLETIPRLLSNPALKSDLIHPNNEGYRQLAENIKRLLIETGALSSD